MIRLLVVDDHAPYRQGLCALLQGQAGLRVIGQAASGEEALAFCASQDSAEAPHVVLLDLRMSGLGGIRTAGRLRALYPKLALLASTSHDDPALVRAFIAAGGNGYLLKGETLPDMVQAITAVAGGESWFSTGVASATQPQQQS